MAYVSPRNPPGINFIDAQPRERLGELAFSYIREEGGVKDLAGVVEGSADRWARPDLRYDTCKVGFLVLNYIVRARSQGGAERGGQMRRVERNTYARGIGAHF